MHMNWKFHVANAMLQDMTWANVSWCIPYLTNELLRNKEFMLECMGPNAWNLYEGALYFNMQMIL